MASKTEAPEPAVDELKRRARRRLVGAVVVALAAAVTLPMLLESDPKPLGNDVSIQIPPIDNSKFVTPLSPDKSPAVKVVPDARPAAAPPVDNIAPSGPAALPAATPKRGLAEAEQHVLGQNRPKTSNPPMAPDSRSAPVATSASPASANATGAVNDATPSAEPPKENEGATATPQDAPTPASSKAPPPPAAPKVSAAGAFQIQVAAFADAKLAADLAKKVKAAGFPAHTEDVPTQQGSVHRVRVGPYPTRTAADAAAGKLKADGYGNAQVVTAK